MTISAYKEAIFEQAVNNSEPAILFERLSDDDCYEIANSISFDAELCAAILHDNCKHYVDTCLIETAMAFAA